MRYTQPLSDQVLMFVSSIGPGVVIGFIYDVIFSFFRTFGSSRWITIAADLLFSVSATLLSFFYMVIYNDGTVRLNIIIAQLIGAVTFHYALGRYMSKPIELFAVLLTKLFSKVFYPIVYILKKSAGYATKMLNNIKIKAAYKEKTEKDKKKTINILKIHLKK